MTKDSILRLGTGRSTLARAWASGAHGRPAAARGKGPFTKEIDALMAGTIGVDEHSIKVMPSWLPDDLDITCVQWREIPRAMRVAAASFSGGA